LKQTNQQRNHDFQFIQNCAALVFSSASVTEIMYYDIFNVH